MLPSPLPYDVRWTCKLLRRDIRNHKTKLKAKLKAKLPSRAKATESAYQEEIDTIIVEHEGSSDAVIPPAQVSRYSRGVQAIAQYDEKADSEEDGDTVRDVLEEQLKETYTSRDRDLPHEDRWKFRGSWLLLYTAVCVNEKFTGATGCHRRYDSGFSTRSKPSFLPTQIWHDVLEATKDSSKINSTAEAILGHVWPAENASTILEQIGNPAKRLSEDKEYELREKLRGLLKGY